MNKLYLGLTVVVMAAMPAVSKAAVVINEIMYSPTSNQWVEVYNDGEEAVDLTKYKVLDNGASVNGHAISAYNGGETLVAAKSYAVIADVPDNLGTLPVPLLKSSLAMLAGGDTVILKLGTEVIDTKSYNDGTAVDGNSLQKTDGNWIAATPTPGAANATEPTVIDNNDDDDDGSTSGSGDSGGGGGGGSSSSTASAGEFSVSLGKKQTVMLGASIKLHAKLSRKGALSGATYHWAFGDGAAEKGNANAEHVYEFPGTYLATIHVDSGGYEANNKVEVVVVEPMVAISAIGTGDKPYIELENQAKVDADLSDWQLAGSDSFTFPQGTVIKAGTKVKLPGAITGLAPNASDYLVLTLPSGDVAADSGTPPVGGGEISSEMELEVARIAASAEELSEKIAALVEDEVKPVPEVAELPPVHPPIESLSSVRLASSSTVAALSQVIELPKPAKPWHKVKELIYEIFH